MKTRIRISLIAFVLALGAGGARVEAATTAAPPSITVPASDPDGTYVVRWKASTTPGVSYLLQEATNSTFTAGVRTVKAGGALRLSILRRSPRTTYYYRVKARSAGNADSPWRSGENGCAVPGTAAAARPGIIAVPAGDDDGSFRVQWEPSATPGATYVLEEATDGAFTAGRRVVSTGSPRSVLVTGRAAGATYFYRVRAMKAGLRDSPWRAGGNGCTAAPAGRIEAAATPTAFAAVAAAVASPSPLALTATITLAPASDGLNPAAERFVLARGADLRLIEPGGFACAVTGGLASCTHADAVPAYANTVTLAQTAAATWELTLSGGTVPDDGAAWFVRIGNDWGGFRPGGAAILALQPTRADEHAAAATIGGAGGSLETIVDGVAMTLRVPPGALTSGVEIRMTPLTASGLATETGLLVPGVQLEPAGLAFAEPATLRFDFSQWAGAPLPGTPTILLATSPLTALPLGAERDGDALTVPLAHFSTYVPGSVPAALLDYADWANPVLGAAGLLTFDAIRILSDLAAQQQALGCTSGCVDLAGLSARLAESLEALAAGTCAADVSSPSDAALERWLRMEQLAQQYGVAVSGLGACAERVLAALVDRAAEAGAADLGTTVHLQRLLSLHAKAQALGFAAVVTKAETAIGTLLTSLIEAAGTSASTVGDDLSLNRLAWLATVAAQLGLPTPETAAHQALAAGLRNALAIREARCGADTTGARAGLQRLLPLSQLAGVALLDPTLDDDILAAIDGCGPSLTVQVLGGADGTTYACGGGGEGEDVCDELGATAALPPGGSLSLSGSGSLGAGALTVGASSDGATVDGTMSGTARLFLTLRLTPRRAGTLTVGAESGFTSVTPSHVLVGQVGVETGLMCHSWFVGATDWCGYYPSVPRVQSAQFPLASVAVFDFDINLDEGGSAAGRALTLHFTPSP